MTGTVGRCHAPFAAPVDPAEEEGAHLGVGTMKSAVSLELLFPIKDASSASFMSFKADCLLDAGIITELDKQWVEAKVLSVLAADHPFAPNVCASTLDLDVPEDQR